MFIGSHKAYERKTGKQHEFVILFHWKGRKVYTVYMDRVSCGDFTSEGAALDRIIDIIFNNDLCAIKPIVKA